nr:asparagine synthase [Canibacter zhuwentaonis]
MAPVAEIIEQGLLVADVAIKMTVKNDIIINVLKHKRTYSEEQAQALVRRAIQELKLERESDAATVGRMRDDIQMSGYAALGEAEFGALDRKALRYREEAHEGVAEELAQRAQDSQYVARVATLATQLAWQEIGDSLKEKASHPYYGGGKSSEYKRVRQQRINDLISKDLHELVHGKPETVQQEAPAAATQQPRSWFKRALQRFMEQCRAQE